MRRKIVPIAILIILGLFLSIESLKFEYILIVPFILIFLSINYLSVKYSSNQKVILKYVSIGILILISTYLYGFLYPFYPSDVSGLEKEKYIRGEVIEVYNLEDSTSGIILLEYKGDEVKLLFNMYKNEVSLFDSNKEWIYGKGCEKRENFKKDGKIKDEIYNYIKKGDLIGLRGNISKIEDPRNPKVFNFKKFYLSKGVKYRFQGNFSDIEIIDHSKGILSYLDSLKSRYQKLLKKHLSVENLKFLNSMLFGETKYVDDESLNIYRRSGIGHLMAVSGVHIGVLYGFLAFVFPFRKRYSFFIFVMSVLLIYGYFSNFSPSVIRAILMVGLHILSKIKFQPYDLLAASLFSSLLICLYNPMILFSLGFKFSFLAIFLISSLQQLFKYGKYPNLKMIFSIQILMIPATIYYFNYISLVGLLINPAISIVVTALIILNFILFILFTFFNIDISFLFNIMENLLNITDWICKKFTVDNVSVFDVSSPNIFLVIGIYFIYFFFSSEQFLILLRGRFNRAIILILLTFILSFSYLYKITEDGEYVRFLDIGQGDGIHIKAEDMNILIDGGGSYRRDLGQEFLKPYFLKNGISRIDIGIVTHMDLDHYGSFFTLVREGMIDEIILPISYEDEVDEIVEFSKLSRDKIHFMSSGDVINLKDGNFFKAIYSGELYREGLSENLRSLVLEGNINGCSMLFTSDIDKGIEEYLLNKGLLRDIDVLKVAHHGSKYSTGNKFLNEVKPEYAIIQVGKNNFGHPAKDTIEKISNNGIILLRNDIHGCISIDMKGNLWRLKKLLD